MSHAFIWSLGGLEACVHVCGRIDGIVTNRNGSIIELLSRQLLEFNERTRQQNILYLS